MCVCVCVCVCVCARACVGGWVGGGMYYSALSPLIFSSQAP